MPLRRAVQLTRADLAAIAELDRRSFAPDEQYDDVFYDEIFASHAFEVLGVADGSERIAGWALIDTRCEPVRIRSLAVHPEFRRRGIATALIRSVVDRHGPGIDLLVKPDNAAAIALYRKLGFTAGALDPQMPERLRMVRSESNV